jgi:hypothetical protein
MSNDDNLPQLHQLSGGSDMINNVLLLFKIEEIEDSENSDEPSTRSRGAFDIPLGQPFDKLMTQSSGASFPSFQHSSDTNSDDESKLKSKENKEVSMNFEDNDTSVVTTHLGIIEEDAKPAVHRAPILLDDDTDDSFNRVAFGMPYPVFSKNPLPQNMSMPL